MNEFENKNVEEKIGPKRKSVQPKIIGGILIGILVIGIVSFAVYKFLKPTAMDVYEKAISVVFEKLDEGLNFLNQNTIKVHYENEKIKNEGSLSFETNIQELQDLASYTFSYDIGLDGQEKEERISLNINKETEELLSGILYMVQDEMIFKSEKLFSGLLKAKMNGGLIIEQTGSLDFSLLVKMLAKIKEATISSFSKEDFSVKDTTFQKEKVTEYSYTINSKTFAKIMTRISDAFLEDENLLNEMSRVYETSIEEIKKGLVSLKEEREIEPITIRLYTKGISKKVYGFAMYKDSQEIISGKEENGYLIKIPALNLNATITKEKIIIEIPLENTTATLEMEQKSDREFMATFKVQEPTNQASLELSLLLSFEKESESIASFNVTGNMVVTNGTTTANFKVNLKNKTSKISEELIDINPEEARDIESLTEEEKTAIENNFKKIFETEDSLNSLLDPFLIPDIEVQNSSYCTKENCQDCIDGYCVCSYYDDDGIEQLIYCEDNFTLSF